MAEADAKQAEGAPADAAAEAQPKKAKSPLVGMIVNGVGIFILTLGAVVAGGFINAILHPETPPPDYVMDPKTNMIKVFVPPPPKEKKKEEKKKEEKKPEGPALFYSIDPALVVNFEEGASVRFLQVGINLITRDSHTEEALKRLDPMIRNNLLLIISNRDYKQMMTREGKDQLRKEALAEVKKILKKEEPEASIEDLLFTSFVVQ